MWTSYPLRLGYSGRYVLFHIAIEVGPIELLLRSCQVVGLVISDPQCIIPGLEEVSNHSLGMIDMDQRGS